MRATDTDQKQPHKMSLNRVSPSMCQGLQSPLPPILFPACLWDTAINREGQEQEVGEEQPPLSGWVVAGEPTSVKGR